MAAVAAGDNVMNSTIANGIGVGGNVQAKPGDTFTVPYWLDQTGQTCEVPVTVDIPVPAGVTANPTSLTFSACGSRTLNTQDVVFTVAGTAAGQLSVPAVVETTAAGVNTNATAFKITVGGDDGGGGGGGDVNNPPTVVGSGAADATGNEGSTLSTSGAFTDPDGDALTITQVGGDGTVTPGTAGAWSWSLPTTDNGTGTVTVRATDPDGLYAEDQFTWTANNVAPTLAALNNTGVNCSPVIDGSFTDPGSADTWLGSVDFGDGSTNAFTSSPFGPFSHTYTTNGPFTITANVSDDDGGAATAVTSTSGYNTTTGIGQPINADGSSIFKHGSTIPVKTSVRGCSGGGVSLPLGSRPYITLNKLTGAIEGAVVEPVISTSAADTGWELRETDAGSYIYNLNTKNTGLTVGTYRMRINHASFATPLVVEFSIKK